MQSYLKPLIIEITYKRTSTSVYVKTRWENFKCFSQMLCNGFTESWLGMEDKPAMSCVE